MVARLVNMKKTAGDSNSKAKNTGYIATHVVNSCQGKVAGVLCVTKLAAPIYSGIGCDTSF